MITKSVNSKVPSMMQHKAKTVLTVSGFQVPKSEHLVKLSDINEKTQYSYAKRPSREMLDKYGDEFYLSPSVNMAWAELVANGVSDFELTDKLITLWGKLLPTDNSLYDILWRAIIENTSNTNTRVEFIRKLVRIYLNGEYDNLITFSSSLSTLEPSVLSMKTSATEAVIRQRTEYTRISELKGESNVDLLQGLLGVHDPYGVQNGNSVVMGVLYTIFGYAG